METMNRTTTNPPGTPCPDSTPITSILQSPVPSAISVVTDAAPGPNPSRPSSHSLSRNDLFTVSWKPEVLPPKPILFDLSNPSLTAIPPSIQLQTGGRDSLVQKMSSLDDPGVQTSSSGVQIADVAGPQALKSMSSHSKTVFSPAQSSTSTLAPADPRAVSNSTQDPVSSRTSSFFNLTPLATITPPPAPRLQASSVNIPAHGTGTTSWAPSPLSLSRSSSLRNRPHQPPPLDQASSAFAAGSSSSFRSGTRQRAATGHFTSPAYNYDDPLSPLHVSPSLPPSTSDQFPSWQPPLPPSSDDIDLRLIPSPTYLLGEGRYAKVFLASYKRDTGNKDSGERSTLKGKGKETLGRPAVPAFGLSEGSENAGNGFEHRDSIVSQVDVDEQAARKHSPWQLCAAKRLAPDRESQTMGLREAFFLNRLSGTSQPTKSDVLISPTAKIVGCSQSRASSPPGNDIPGSTKLSKTENRITEVADFATARETSIRNRQRGSVYVVKLIAVKEDFEGDLGRSRNAVNAFRGSEHLPGSAGGGTHGRSASYAVTSESKERASSHIVSPSQDGNRQRSSSILSRTVDDYQEQLNFERRPSTTLMSFPSLPSLGQTARAEVLAGHLSTQTSLSRLVLVLEHAPLGTLDRLLRTSPGLVGKQLWGRWARESAAALVWVHGKGVVHADVKPGNLLLTTDLHLRLSDFGSSLLIHPAHPPTDGLGLGTLPFSPPELVDPAQTFSFPVDIFALGATLYQCLTGREPFRASRTVEMMHHVRKGGLWDYEERERLSRVGSDHESAAGSPYPSAWRGQDGSVEGGVGSGGGVVGVRRGGSLRVPKMQPSAYRGESMHGASPTRSTSMSTAEPTSASAATLVTTTPGGAAAHKPRLNRMSSADSLRASDEIVHGAHGARSPAGVKLWAKWMKRNSGSLTSWTGSGNPYSGIDPISLLLIDEEEWPTSPSPLSTTDIPTFLGGGESLRAGINNDFRNNDERSHSRRSSISTNLPSPLSPVSPGGMSLPISEGHSQSIPPPNPGKSAVSGSIDMKVGGQGNDGDRDGVDELWKPYTDGSPAMLFLDGDDRVSEDIRVVLKRMLDPSAERRPSAGDVLEAWEALEVGDGEGEVESEV